MAVAGSWGAEAGCARNPAAAAAPRHSAGEGTGEGTRAPDGLGNIGSSAISFSVCNAVPAPPWREVRARGGLEYIFI